MRPQVLVGGWIVTIVAVLVALVWLVGQWNTLGRLGRSAHAERIRLAGEVNANRDDMQAELVAHAELLREMRWNPERGSAADVVRRLATLAQGSNAKVLAISALGREATPRFRKSWHQLEMTGPFRDFIEFAARVEREGGIVEDLVLQPVQDQSGRGAAPGEIRSQFRLTAVEPSDEARAIMDRSLAAARAAGAPIAALTLPVNDRPVPQLLALRDPFRPAERPRPPVAVAARPRPAATAGLPPAPVPAAPPASPEPLVPVTVKGIVKFPGGAMAIVNEQIVGVGDVVAGHRVQEITDRNVVLAVPGGEPRIAQLPGFAAGSRSTH